MAWRVGGQWTCLFYRHRHESSPKDGKVLPSIGMTLNPAPTTSFTTQLSGHLGHEDHEGITHAMPCSPCFSAWPCGCAWGSWAGLCLLTVCMNCFENLPFRSYFPASQEWTRRFGNSHCQVTGCFSSVLILSQGIQAVSQLENWQLVLYQGPAPCNSPAVTLSPRACLHGCRWLLSPLFTCWVPHVHPQTTCLHEVLCTAAAVRSWGRFMQVGNKIFITDAANQHCVLLYYQMQKCPV